MPRLAGKQGSVYLGANKISDIYNITFEIELDLAEAGVKLETHEVYAAGRMTSRLSGERYITDTATDISGNPEVGGSVWGKNIVANVPASGNNYVGATVLWTFHTIDGSSVKGFTLNGEGFLERVTQNNPRGAVSELWEIRNISLPTVTN